MQVPKLYRWTRLISFRIFLVAFIVTLIGLSLLGRWYSQQNIYQNFVRFHLFVHPGALYYPTISQLRAIAKDQLQDRKKIGVIVGGSSVFNGVKQSPEKIWTKKLQELLGDRYRVINLAFHGGLVQGGGAITAQSLLNEGYKIIFISDMVMGEFVPDGTKVYNYFLWDAIYKGLISYYPQLEQYIQSMQTSNSNLGELKLRAWLDSIFYSNDLWTTIGYKHFFTVWNFLIAGNYPTASFTKPRYQTVDPDTGYEPPPTAERYEALEQSIKGMTEQEHRIIAGYCERLYEWKQDKWVVNSLMLNELKRQAQATFPESFRSHTLLVMIYRSPFYFETMEPRYHDCWKQGSALGIELVQKAGYWAVDGEKNFSPEDYADSVHLIPSGGAKLAREIAPKIQQIAASLGYLK